MYKRSRLAGILGCAAVLAMVGCSASSGLTPNSGATTQLPEIKNVPMGLGWIQKDGVTYHVPHYMMTAQMAHAKVKPAIVLSYSNGPVLTKPKAYLILWGYGTYGDADGVGKLLKNYVKVMGKSTHNEIYVQYYEKVNGKTISIKNPRNQYGGVWEDDTDPVPTNPSDSQVAAEALVGVSHFGYDPNGSYVVATPHGRSSPGFGTSFCAYHSATMNNGKLVSYTNLPYMPDAGANCGANFTSPPTDESGTDEGVTIVEGHEYGESVTDPNPPSGWYNNQEGEIGDICAWQDIENDPFRNHSYTSQPMFSNATQTCVQSYAP